MKQTTMNPFTQPNFTKDLTASIAVFLVAIPLCLGIAHASGVPLMSGILAGVIGGVVVGLLSGSSLSVTGPAAGLVALVITGISELGGLSGFLVAILLAGLLQLCFGVFKLGRFADLFPKSVIEGMLAGIGVIIVLKQFSVFVGAGDGFAYQPVILGLGLSSLAVMFLWEKKFASRFKLISASLVAVAFCAVLAYIITHAWPELALGASMFVTIPVVESALHFFDLLPKPDWSVLSNYVVYKHAVLIAVVASLETLLCISGIEAIDPQKRPPANKDRELMAQGLGNMLAGFLGALPVTSVIVRSSVNLNAGAIGKRSTILHGLLLLLALFTGAALLSKIPLVALAAILIFTGYKLAHPTRLISFYRKGVLEFIPFLTTIVVCVAFDLLSGIIAGVAIHFIVQQVYKPTTTSNVKGEVES